ncbi:MAG: alcohol dehydrogenase catalytic domain-containing protein [Desulfobacteraceae bacterium]
MNVLRLHNKGNFKLHQESAPIPQMDEVLLKVTAVGICGSDLTYFKQGNIGSVGLLTPLVLGHEFAGIIESVNLNGEHVAADPAICCHNCSFCNAGHPNLCENMRFAGHGEIDGGLREKLCWPKAFVYSLPYKFSSSDGVMLEPLGVALHALDLGHIKPGMTIGIFGCGPIGLILIQLARIQGAGRIIATDPLSHRLDAARSFGAIAIQASEEGKEWEAVWAATRGRGVDIAFEAACNSMAVKTAIRTTRPGRQVILIGIPEDDHISFSASIARRKALNIRLVRRMKHTYPRAIHLVKTGVVDVRSLVTHKFSLSEYEQAFEVAAKREGIKVIIEPNA